MASIVGGVVQESSVGWKTNASKGQKKGVLSGRTPLGDLSNSLKPNSVTAAKKKNINAQPSKKQQATTRKALSDISNSGRPNLNEAPKKSISSKLSVLAEEPIIDASEIVGEQLLHNHQQCIKAQSKAMDLDLFLQTLGLDNDPPKLQSIPMPYQSPPRRFQLKEMAEEFIIEDPWKHKLTVELDSPPPVRSPKHFMDYDYKFELLGWP